MAKKSRRHHRPDEKLAILKEHLVDHKPVSEVCEAHGVQPSLFYYWQRQLFENGAAAVAPSSRVSSSRDQQQAARIERLEAKLTRKDSVIAEISEDLVQLKKRTWGALTGRGVPHDTRDEVVDFVRDLAEKTEVVCSRIVRWLGVARGKFASWVDRYGRANEHKALVPRDHWIEPDERTRLLAFHAKNSLEGYRRLTFMMLDQDIVAVSPSTTYRVLSAAGVIDRWNKTPSKKGSGFVQPQRPHEHWHVDIAYLNILGTFYYLCSVLDGASRAIVHHEIREAMKESDVELILQRAREKPPDARPRVISDNGPQFHRARLQGVHPGRRHGPRPHLALLPAVQRYDRALAHDSQARRDPRSLAREHRPRSASRRRVRGTLQQRAAAQRDRLHHAERLPRRSYRGDLGRARSQARSRPRRAGRTPPRCSAGRCCLRSWPWSTLQSRQPRLSRSD